MPHIGPVEYRIDATVGVVTLTSHADPTIGEWVAAIEAILADPAFEPGFGFLSDRRAVREVASSAFVREAARHLALRSDVFAATRWAVLSADAVSYGMARMGQAYLGAGGPEVQIFADAAQAMAWLCEGRRRTDEP